MTIAKTIRNFLTDPELNDRITRQVSDLQRLGHRVEGLGRSIETVESKDRNVTKYYIEIVATALQERQETQMLEIRDSLLRLETQIAKANSRIAAIHTYLRKLAGQSLQALEEVEG